MASKQTANNFLERAEIDLILEGMTARDIFSSIGGGELKGTEVAGAAFESSAKRQGYGELVLDRVRPQDAVYLATKLSETFATDGLKADASGT